MRGASAYSEKERTLQVGKTDDIPVHDYDCAFLDGLTVECNAVSGDVLYDEEDESMRFQKQGIGIELPDMRQ